MQSAVGNNVFSTRTLAASWPYLALSVSALITVGQPRVRTFATAFAVVAFGIGAATMLTRDFRRPEFSEMAAYIDRRGEGVVVDIASLSPGPLTNLDVEGSTPAVPVFRLTVPEQKEIPFALDQFRPDPYDVARRAVAAAGDGPITILSRTGRAQFERSDDRRRNVAEFVDLLPEGYTLTEVKSLDGLYGLKALVYERTGT